MFERINIPRKPLVLARAVLRRTYAKARAFWAAPANRERTKSSAVFAAIFAFTLAGVDYVLTGGPDLNPGGVAYAMEIPQSAHGGQRAGLVVRAGPLAPQPAAEQDGAVALAPVDYSFTTETLLGGPDTVLASYERFADATTRAGVKPELEPALEVDAIKSKTS